MKHYLGMLAIFTLTCSICFAIESPIKPPFGNTQVISTFVKPGDFVKKGQLIARLDTNELKAKLALLRQDKKQLETEAKLTKKLMKKTKARRAQRMHDKEQNQIDANQIISGLSNLSSLKNKSASNLQIENDIKELSSSHQKQKHLHAQLNETLKSLTASEIKFEELIEAAEVKSPCDGMILDLASPNQKIQNKHQSLGTIERV
ncbi:MAG: biotin/lipoyl-binding protein [Pseudomonadota bacterium]|nr:biotin/lipoyl-binding protein [Pseudomonadota bacterium]